MRILLGEKTGCVINMQFTQHYMYNKLYNSVAYELFGCNFI